MTDESQSARSCRLCDESNDKMYSIFETNVLNIQIIKIIQDCLPILIYENDPLSKFVCHSCNENLNMFYEFKKSCVDIANKHRDDLQGAKVQNPAIELYLNKIRDFEESDNFNEVNAENESDHTMNYESLDNDTNSQMSQMDTDVSFSPRKECNSECGLAIDKKPRVSGPKSKTHSYKQITKTEEIVYQPLKLFELVVQHVNQQNFTDLNTSYSNEETVVTENYNYCCRYCEETFEDENKLAVHELDTHIKLHLVKVDMGSAWTENQEDFNVRNNWIDSETQNQNDKSAIKTGENGEGDGEKDLLVPISASEEPLIEPKKKIVNLEELDVSRNYEISFVGDVAYAQGVPLKRLSKDVRYSFYRGARMSGVKKKFCPLCRYTFKDNWSVDHHYLQQICQYSCHYCGLKFKRNRQDHAPHTAAHIAAGHKLADCVFMTNFRGDIVELDTSSLQPPLPPSTANQTRTKPPPPKPTPMKLRVRQAPVVTPPPATYSPPIKPTPMQVKKEPPQQANNFKKTNDEMNSNQAYFCKKCYQVFTKLANYNVHVKSCKGLANEPEIVHQAPSMHSPQNYKRNITKKMPELKPLPGPIIKIKQENGIISSVVETFPCQYCPSVFKSVYSRNSHMRMHVDQKAGQNTQTKSQKRPASSQMYNSAKKIKEESSFEPIVEIHEGATTTIGSVSITPLKRIASPQVNPDVMRLVQNNPNISLKPRVSNPFLLPKPPGQGERTMSPMSTQSRSPQFSEEIDSSKGYKCASCFQLFANKSNLYFHKKNQCTGSRFPCPFCKKRFGTASEYSSHIFYSHPE